MIELDTATAEAFAARMENMLNDAFERRRLSILPSEYFKHQAWIGFSPGGPTFPVVVEFSTALIRAWPKAQSSVCRHPGNTPDRLGARAHEFATGK
jgi:hypothetical protein